MKPGDTLRHKVVPTTLVRVIEGTPLDAECFCAEYVHVEHFGYYFMGKTHNDFIIANFESIEHGKDKAE